jgi:hypothetical protein
MKQRKRADEAELLHPATKHLPRNKHVLMAREAIILDELWSGISPTSQEVTQAPFCAETPAAVDERAHSERQVQDVDTVRPQETGAAHTQEADAFTTLSKISTNPLQSVSTLESDSNKAKRCAFKQSVTEKIKIIKEQEKGVWKSQIPLPPTQINPIPPRASETTPSSATFKEPSRDPLHADQVKPALDAQHSVYRHVELPPCESLASGPVHSSSSLLTHTPVTETPMAMLLAPHGALLSQPYQAHGNPCGRSLFPAPPPTFAQSHIPAAVAPSSHMSFNSASQDMPSSDESPYQPNVSNIDLRSDRGIRPSDRMVLTGSDCANSKGCGTGTRGAVALQKTIHRWLFSRALAWAIPAGETREMVQEALDRAEWNFAAAEVVAIVDAECSAIEELASTTAAEALYEEETAERPFKMA